MHFDDRETLRAEVPAPDCKGQCKSDTSRKANESCLMYINTSEHIVRFNAHILFCEAYGQNCAYIRVITKCIKQSWYLLNPITRFY
jgi:hypothetical protein